MDRFDTSLGGLRPTCTVVDDDGHLSIGKFPSVTDERTVTKGEVLALSLAMRAGITAAPLTFTTVVPKASRSGAACLMHPTCSVPTREGDTTLLRNHP